MLDRWIFILNCFFIAAVCFWAFSAWRELWITRNIRDSFSFIAHIVNAPDTFDLKSIPDCLIARGLYKNRYAVCRLCHITPTKLFYYRVEIHCHIEPVTKADRSFSYKSTSSSETKRFLLTEKISERDFLEILEEVTRAAEIVESKEPWG